MAEAIGVASSVISLASTAYKTCQTLHNAVDCFRGAHHQILTLSSELEGFYLVLGTLQAVLQDEVSSAAAVEQVMSDGLSRTLKGSMEIFKEITAVIGTFKAPEPKAPPGAWRKAKWTFKEKTIADLRKELLERKMTLNIAICVANEYNLRAVRTSTNKIQLDVCAVNAAALRIEAEMAEHLRELESKLPAILQQQEDVLAMGPAKPGDHSEEDRTNVRTDLHFTIRRFVDSAAASLSSNLTPQTPSFQVSSFEVSSSTQASTYHIAPSRQGDASAANIAIGRTQVFVRNAGLFKTLVFQIDSELTIEQLKERVRDRLKLPEAQFNFVYSGRLIPHNSHKILRECGVTKDDTFTCVSFLPVPPPQPVPRRPFPPVKIVVKTLDGKEQDCHISPGARIWALKCDYTWRINKISKGLPRIILDPHDIDFVYKGNILDNNNYISSSQFVTDGEDLVFHALASPDAEWQPPKLKPTSPATRRKTSPLILDEVPSLTGPFGMPIVPRKRLYYGPCRVSFRRRSDTTSNEPNQDKPQIRNVIGIIRTSISRRLSLQRIKT